MNYELWTNCFYTICFCENKVDELCRIGFAASMFNVVEKFGTKFAQIRIEKNDFFYKHKRSANPY